MNTLHLFFPRIRSGAPYLYIKKGKKKSYIWSSKPKEYVHNRHRDGNNIATNKELKTARLDRGL